MMKMLLAVDGSEASLRATRKLIELSAQFKEPIRVELVAVHLPVPKIGGFSSHVLTKDKIDRYYREEGEQMLAAARKLLDESGVAYESHILVGTIAETIVEHGDSAGCRMIYMGTRGMSALPNLVLGSIATKVVHLSLIPVVLVS